MLIMNGEWVRIWEEATVAYLDISQNSRRKTETSARYPLEIITGNPVGSRSRNFWNTYLERHMYVDVTCSMTRTPLANT
jgi:hypothetical protein